MIRTCTIADAPAIFRVINDAARVYCGVIPQDCYQEPYMPMEELLGEMERMTFFGWQEKENLVGVMGFQPVQDVTLIRHAYVMTERQGQGIGTRLLDHLRSITVTGRVLIGTWADATWAIKFYERHGFALVPNKIELLRRYWTVPERQIEASVVLGIEQGKASIGR